MLELSEEKSADKGMRGLCLVSDNGSTEKLGLTLHITGHLP